MEGYNFLDFVSRMFPVIFYQTYFSLQRSQRKVCLIKRLVGNSVAFHNQWLRTVAQPAICVIIGIFLNPPCPKILQCRGAEWFFFPLRSFLQWRQPKIRLQVLNELSLFFWINWNQFNIHKWAIPKFCGHVIFFLSSKSLVCRR